MLTQNDLQKFTGTEQYHGFGLVGKMTKAVLTDGAMHVAKSGGAFWLMDEIAVAIGGVAKQNDRLASIQFWNLSKNKKGGGKLVCREDSGIAPAYVKNLDYTDFPLESIDLWVQPTYIGETQYWVIHLPSEY